jgi:hypothetical protein
MGAPGNQVQRNRQKLCAKRAEILRLKTTGSTTHAAAIDNDTADASA